MLNRLQWRKVIVNKLITYTGVACATLARKFALVLGYGVRGGHNAGSATDTSGIAEGCIPWGPIANILRACVMPKRLIKRY